MLDKIFSAKKVLFIGAHPDDIEFYCAGLVYLLRQRQVEVVYAIATRGGRGYTGNAKIRLESLRSQHQQNAVQVLGGAKVIFFDYPDKSLAEHVEPLSEDIKAVINEEKPDFVFSWDPDYIYNPHPDHQAAADAGKLAGIEPNLCFYGTQMPNLRVGYDEDVFQIKLRSLREHRTETPWFYFPIQKRCLIKRQRPHGSMIGFKYAETFRCECSD